MKRGERSRTRAHTREIKRGVAERVLAEAENLCYYCSRTASGSKHGLLCFHRVRLPETPQRSSGRGGCDPTLASSRWEVRCWIPKDARLIRTERILWKTWKQLNDRVKKRLMHDCF